MGAGQEGGGRESQCITFRSRGWCSAPGATRQVLLMLCAMTAAAAATATAAALLLLLLLVTGRGVCRAEDGAPRGPAAVSAAQRRAVGADKRVGGL